MKRSLVFALAIAFLGACSTKEIDIQTPVQDYVVFYATVEQPTEEGTKVYANKDLLLRWTADDRVSIFNKISYNQQYRFTGETGDNAGGFRKVDSDEFISGNTISHVVSIYPYQETTKISESEVITVTLPTVQSYADNSFGLGANTMVSVSSDNVLQYKNIGGYLMLKLHGKGVFVSSITLKGNNGEKLAGKASVTMPLDGIPTVEMASDAATEITLECATPVELGATAEESTQFWFVVPPVTFEKGFTVIIDTPGGMAVRSTAKSLTIERNNLSKMTAFRVDCNQNNVIYYTSSDGSIVTPSKPSAFDANIISNVYVEGVGILSFDGEVTSIGNQAFEQCAGLTGISIPESVTVIGDNAFYQCGNLTGQLVLPDGLTSIGNSAFSGCGFTGELVFPEGLTAIGNGAFSFCRTFTGDLVLPEGLTSLGSYAFYECTGFLGDLVLPKKLTIVSDSAFTGCCGFTGRLVLPEELTTIEGSAFGWCTGFTGELVLPKGLNSVGGHAFYDCKHFTGQLVLPEGLTSIGDHAFYYCTGLSSMTALPVVPPTGADQMFGWNYFSNIYVPYGSVDAYKTAEYWKDYAHQILAIQPEAVDMGRSVKWASFNLGATVPEDYGDYYAWGETELKDDYSWETYKWCNGAYYKLNKYCPVDKTVFWGGAETPDDKTGLEPEDDVAHVNLGGNWRMPTFAEITELIENCSWVWTTQNGVNGRLVTGTNGNSIFLPAAGRRDGTNLNDAGSKGYYWSSSLDSDIPQYVWNVSFSSGEAYRNDGLRHYGYTVRPVTE